MKNFSVVSMGLLLLCHCEANSFGFHLAEANHLVLPGKRRQEDFKDYNYCALLKVSNCLVNVENKLKVCNSDNIFGSLYSHSLKATKMPLTSQFMKLQSNDRLNQL